MNNNNNTTDDDFPSSVEEAAALLGAAITKAVVVLQSSQLSVHSPPAGMHSAFACLVDSRMNDLIHSLSILRALLRSTTTVLTAAPSIVQVLKKVLGLSTRMANTTATTTNTATNMSTSTSTATAASSQQSSTSAAVPRKTVLLKHKRELPPLLSTACRRVWVDCMVLCFQLDPATQQSNKSAMDSFLRSMLALACVHPRSSKAAGGVRVAAFAVVQGLLAMITKERERKKKLSSSSFSSSSSWAVEVVPVCAKALKSAGQGEPTLRITAMHAAIAAVQSTDYVEEKTVQEAIRVVKQATSDKYPEVRYGAACLATAVANMIVLFMSSKNTASCLAMVDELWLFCGRNVDDESPLTSQAWSAAAAQCITTAMTIHQHEKSVQQQQSDTPSSTPSSTSTRKTASSSTANTPTTILAWASSPIKAMEYMVEQFTKLTDRPCGGPFSTGGRAVRLGYAMLLVYWVREHFDPFCPTEKVKEQVLILLRMVTSTTPLRNKPAPLTVTEMGLIRLYTGRVLRQGITEHASEAVQVSLLHLLMDIVPIVGTEEKQIVLAEISHLLATLQEAAAFETVAQQTLNTALAHENRFIRYEAAVACAALVQAFPSWGQVWVHEALEEVETHFAHLLVAISTTTTTTASRSTTAAAAESGAMRLFRRSPSKTVDAPTNPFRPHQAVIHGRTLLVSMLLRDMSQGGGIDLSALIQKTIQVSETLVSCQWNNETLASTSNEAVFACVRAGYCMISGVMAMATSSIDSAVVNRVFSLWRKAVDGFQHNDANKTAALLTPEADIICVDAVLTSLVVFLKHRSELLLVIPEALHQITVLLEDVFPLMQPTGRLGQLQTSPRFESVMASLLEAFAWLPSGSFPLLANHVFDLATQQIEKAIEQNITCSILYSLVSKEDFLLDAKSLCRANTAGQAGGAWELEETIISLTADVTTSSDLEAVMHLQSRRREESIRQDTTQSKRKTSGLLNAFSNDASAEKPPTPLHEVGTWRRPLDPSSSARVRTVDASIQAFSAVFGLKDGKEQQSAMEMLEKLVPPFLSQLARTIGINAVSMDTERRAKPKEDPAAIANITAVLLSCLQAIPLHEATHNVPITLGPPWMNKAKDLLLMLLPSASTIVRRGAAEGLALLATLGVTEDAHFLQSTLLQNLDEVMQGNKPDGKARALALEPISAARAGSLHTLACIQRTAHNVAVRKRSRARGRVTGSKTEEAVEKTNEELPVLHMLTRILPSAACHEFKDYFVVRTYALHSFALLLSYSARLHSSDLGPEDKQLIIKGIELADSNFAESWAIASFDADRGQEPEKLSSEIAFLAVLTRLMTLLLPFIAQLDESYQHMPKRFSFMTTVILEAHASHPSIFIEAIAFFEMLSATTKEVSFSSNVVYSENPLLSWVPTALEYLNPMRNKNTSLCLWDPNCFLHSTRVLRSLAYGLKLVSERGMSIARLSEMKGAALLFGAVEEACGRRHFEGGNLLRHLATNRESERMLGGGDVVIAELSQCLHSMFATDENDSCSDQDHILRWLLMVRQILSPIVAPETDPERNNNGLPTQLDVTNAAIIRSISDTALMSDAYSSVRWQPKCLASQFAAWCLRLLKKDALSSGNNVHFDLESAVNVCKKECSGAVAGALPGTKAVFHLEELLTAACKSSTSIIEQAELSTLQECSVHFLLQMIGGFGPTRDPEEPTESILNQFSTQILSAVRHATNTSASTNTNVSASRLFVVGCEAMHTVLSVKMIKDANVIKRLARATIPESSQLPEFRPSEGLSSKERLDLISEHGGMNILLSKLLSAARLIGHCDENVVSAVSDFMHEAPSLAVHLGAYALDACRFLYRSNLSLAGVQKETELPEVACDGGIFFSSDAGLDELSLYLFATSWSTCCSGAVGVLLNRATKAVDTKSSTLVSEWIHTLVPLLVAGVHDSLNALTSENKDVLLEEWSKGVDASTVLKDCLKGIGLLISWEGLDQMWRTEFANLFDVACDKVVMPMLHNVGLDYGDGVLEAVTDFISTYAMACAIHNQESEGSFLARMLRPLDMLQKEEVIVDGKTNTYTIVDTCMKCLGAFVAQGHPSDSLIAALLDLAESSILTSTEKGDSFLKESSLGLFVSCLLKLPPTRQRYAVSKLGSLGIWDAWSSAAKSVRDNLDLSVVREALSSDDPKPVLVAVRTAQVFPNVMGEVLETLHEFGTLPKSNRQEVCAEAMKVILLANQMLSAGDREDDFVAFLTILFETLLVIIRSNGLPNHPSQGDPDSGRMAAQAIVHVARTSPLAFKTTISELLDHDRTLLEFSVRAEMTGYEVAAAPTKKKLNLAGFKSRG